MSFDLKKFVSTVAPTLATYFGTPLAGVAVKELCTKFLGDPNASEEQLATALQQATPADLLKIKEIDNQFAKDMAELDVRILDIDRQDRDSARKRAADMHDWSPILIGILIYGFYGYVTNRLFTASLDPSIKDVLLPMFGTLTALVIQVSNFIYGSSTGSRIKDSVAAMVSKVTK